MEDCFGLLRYTTFGLQGETAEEVAGLAKAMRARCIHVPTAGDVLDIVGTGGDGIGSVNISTGATVIAAAAGAKVAKHGNRSVSSLCGSADVLEVGILVLLISQGLLGDSNCRQMSSGWPMISCQNIEGLRPWLT